MTATNVRVQMQQRRDTAANWTSTNPTLLNGELGYETDTNKFKIGNGTATWSALAYVPGFAISAYPLATADIADNAITAAKIADGVIANAEISSTAEIAVSKLANGTANQVLVTNSDGATVSFSDNLSLDGFLGVVGQAVFLSQVTIEGNLTVNGTTTTIDSTTLVVEDKNIEIGKVSTPSDTTADGGGITLKGATDKTINWINATDAWTFSEHLNIASAKEFRIAGTKVLDATSLGAAVVGSSLTSVGTIATGVWNGTPIATDYIADDAITSAKIVDGTIVNADVNASAAIVGTKISPDFGSQAITTTGIINANGKVSFPLGTAAAPSLLPGADTNTGIFSPGADSLAIATAGAQRVTVDSSGRVGIGTTSPAQKLVVDGNIQLGTSSGSGKLYLSSSSGFSPRLEENSNALSVLTNNNERLRIDNSGNVGIGTSSPSTKVHITNNSNSSTQYLNSDADLLISAAGTKGAVLKLTNSGSSTESAIVFDQSGTLKFNARENERMRIDSSGKVGIGNTGPQQALHVTQSGGNNFAGIRSQNSNSGIGIAGIEFSSDVTYAKAAIGQVRDNPNGAGSLVFYNASSIGAANWSTADERMRIDRSGNVFIGGTSAATADIALNANGSASFKSRVTAELSDPNNACFNAIHTGTGAVGIDIQDSTGVKTRLKADGSATFAGTVTATAFSGDGSNLTNLPASGGGGGGVSIGLAIALG